jgi:uncharacterized membrane protein
MAGVAGRTYTMLTTIALALGLGFVSGLRVFTAPAAVMLARGGIPGYVFAVLALGEYVTDALPATPARTELPSVIARVLSGVFVGWTIATHGGSSVAGAAAGVIGAFVGTYGGKAARLAAIARIGAMPAALAEDAVAIGLAAFLVTR